MAEVVNRKALNELVSAALYIAAREWGEETAKRVYCFEFRYPVVRYVINFDDERGVDVSGVDTFEANKHLHIKHFRTDEGDETQIVAR